MDLADALQCPAGLRRVLVKLRGAVELSAWTDEGDGTFSTIVPHVADARALVGAIEVDGVEIAAQDFTAYVDGSLVIQGTACGDTEDPRDCHVLAVLHFHYSNQPKEFGGIPYDGRLLTVPRLRLAVPEYFGGIGQLGGGSLVLANGDGLLDRLAGVAWRDAVLALGIEVS